LWIPNEEACHVSFLFGKLFDEFFDLRDAALEDQITVIGLALNDFAQVQASLTQANFGVPFSVTEYLLKIADLAFQELHMTAIILEQLKISFFFMIQSPQFFRTREPIFHFQRTEVIKTFHISMMLSNSQNPQIIQLGSQSDKN